MDDRLHLHDGERLLLSMKPASSRLIVALLRGLLEGMIFALVIAGIIQLIGMLIAEDGIPWIVHIIVGLLIVAGILYRRFVLWRKSDFRVTTERILPHYYSSLFFGHPHHTIKWSQYQESYTQMGSIFDMFFGARTLCIRYGTADAKVTLSFPSLSFANDIKHYLDKVDSAVRKQQEAQLKPFVAAPRGRRDGAETIQPTA
jgi:hypothetical protein